MAAGPSLFRDRDDPVLRAGNGAPHEEEVSLRVHPDHPEPDLGVALGSHVTGHPLPLDDARRVGARADRARLPMPRVAVGGGTTAEMVAMHHALKTTSLGGAGHL